MNKRGELHREDKRTIVSRISRETEDRAEFNRRY